MTVYGSEGRIRLYYTLDIVQPHRDGRAEPETTAHPRTGLLADLVDARDGPTERLLCDLDDTDSFTTVLDAVRVAPRATRIQDEFVETRGSGDAEHVVVSEVEH